MLDPPTSASSPDLRTLAHEALIYTWPLYEMRRARASTSHATLPEHGTAQDGQHWCNTFAHRRELIRPGASRIVTPNNDTLYSVAWLDLSAGPLVIDVPDTHGRYCVLSLMDGLTNPFAHVGTRLHGPGAHSVLVSMSSWRGDVPDAYLAPGTHVRSDTRWVWVIGRFLVAGAEDLPPVHALQNALRIQSLAGGAQVPRGFSPACDPDEPLGAMHFANQVNAALEECAGSQAIGWDRIRAFGAVGIGPGLSPTPDQLQTLESVIEDVRRLLQVPKAIRGANQWEHLPMIEGSFGDDHLLRAHVSQQYIGMVESKEAIYPMTWHDQEGERLRGDRSYDLYFEPHLLPPVDAFWSLTLYDSATCRLVDNPIDRYAIGDRTPGLVRDAQGGLRIRIGHGEPPPGSHANWLPAPQEEFYLCLRAYLPRPEFLDGRYQLPPVRRLPQ